ncbi:hypothetical protein VCNHCC008D_003308B, partial [Vibrio cholerae O1 str. NHCC-008D]
SAP